MKYEILSVLDDVESIYIESDIAIMDSLADAYKRASVVWEQYKDEELFSDLKMYQEGEILDKAMGNKYENILYRILAFIPRLLIATAESIKKTFSDDNVSENENGIDKAAMLFQSGSPDEKHKLQQYVNSNSEGKVILNDDGTIDTPDFKVGIPGHIEFLLSSKKIMDRIKQEMDVNSQTAYQQLADNIQNILDKREEFNSNTAKLTFAALKQCGKDIVTLAPALTESIGIVGKKLNKEIEEMEQTNSGSEKDKQQLIQARNALAKIQKWSKLITSGNRVWSIVSGLFKGAAFLNTDIKDLGKKTEEMTPEEREAKINERRENAAQERAQINPQDNEEVKNLKTQLNALKLEIEKQQAALNDATHNEEERTKIQEKINELNAKSEEITNELNAHGVQRENTAEQQNQQITNQLQQIEKQQNALTKKINKYQDAYNASKAKYTKIVGNGDINNAPIHLRPIALAHKSNMDNYNKTLQELNAKKTKLDEKHASLDNQRPT